ncbi:hypothetical protein [Paenibacillus sp. BAC0078]
MKKLKTTEFQEIRQWMYRNARPIDLAIWQYHFESGSKEAVLLALSAYQNSDKGFGLALEADNWNPNSSPYATGKAIAILDEIGISDLEHSYVEGILEYLDNCEYFSETGWPFTIPSNNDFPHAPWWTYSEQNNADNGFHATAGLVGFIFQAADRSSGLYKKALTLGDKMMDKIRQSGQIEVHELGGYCTFLRGVERAKLTDRYDCVFLADRLEKLVDEAIERDPGKWPVYSMRPSMYISSPASIFYKGNEEVVGKELEYILESRNDEGVWEITWKWADYPKEFVVAENWWKAHWAIHNVLLLRNFDRIG